MQTPDGSASARGGAGGDLGAVELLDRPERPADVDQPARRLAQNLARLVGAGDAREKTLFRPRG
jgi:hypothetical protein